MAHVIDPGLAEMVCSHGRNCGSDCTHCAIDKSKAHGTSGGHSHQCACGARLRSYEEVCGDCSHTREHDRTAPASAQVPRPQPRSAAPRQTAEETFFAEAERIAAARGIGQGAGVIAAARERPDLHGAYMAELDANALQARELKRLQAENRYLKKPRG